ncbi:asparagine synthase (glutamine-hydrolyzing) [Mumia sp. zg.B21]|uniref:asparagine synthase (glutamine-hydrolyzing) n=1 Tax=Mumia sp. zg.B21 TaxID=2855447 RepID=UPI0027E29598|nr:asparagine synthase (glutamine-hydrolyzing) [Mumia sp. zg.B21]
MAGAFQQPDGKELVVAMSERLGPRGPDASGLVETSTPSMSCVLAHRRLSIIDLSSSADQPMVKHGLVLVFNGEIYNYRELRAQLSARGAEFATDSDTEVLLEAWREWGTGALARLRGMFALAVLDQADESLTLARDPFGIKPLFVLPRGEGILFASELKALVAAVGPELSVDPTGLVASALYYWLPPDVSAVAGVTKLPAGTWQRHEQDGRTRSGVFWDPVEEAAAAAAGPRADVGQVIADSVDAHLVADVDVATFLSGGLDSSLITALAHRRNPDIEAYTIAFRAVDQRLEAMPDDARFARQMAASLGIRLHEIEIAPDVVDLLPTMVDVLDEPIGDPAALNTYLMCHAARESGVKVLLSGMGADELFGGYRKHLACLIAARYRRAPRRLRHLTTRCVDAMPVAVAGRGVRSVRWAQRFVSFADLPEEEAFRRSYTLYAPDDLAALVSPELAPAVTQVVDGHRATYDEATLDDQIARMCLMDSRMFMSGLNLTYTDRASMAASTEVRVPFVDPSVFRAAFSLPGRTRISGRHQKVALKEAARQWLPDTIVDRPKASFGAPLRAWVTTDLRELLDDVLVEGELIGSGVVRRDPLLQMLRDQRAGRRDMSKQLWQLLSLELWYRSVRRAGVAAI